MTQPIIRFSGVNKWFGNFHALRDINLDIAQGERVVICGPSGSGKSTLIRCINGLETYEEGQLTVDGIDVGAGEKALAQVRQRVGMVFQQFNLFPHLTVLENLTLAPTLIGGRSAAAAEGLAMQQLARVRIGEQAGKYPQQLSGGQQQRAAIARAIVGDPKLILADEPTGNLDTENGAQVMDILTALNQAGATIIMVTHSPAHADLARRRIDMLDGRIVASAARAI